MPDACGHLNDGWKQQRGRTHDRYRRHCRRRRARPLAGRLPRPRGHAHAQPRCPGTRAWLGVAPCQGRVRADGARLVQGPGRRLRRDDARARAPPPDGLRRRRGCARRLPPARSRPHRLLRVGGQSRPVRRGRRGRVRRRLRGVSRRQRARKLCRAAAREGRDRRARRRDLRGGDGRRTRAGAGRRRHAGLRRGLGRRGARALAGHAGLCGDGRGNPRLFRRQRHLADPRRPAGRRRRHRRHRRRPHPPHVGRAAADHRRRARPRALPPGER